MKETAQKGTAEEQTKVGRSGGCREDPKQANRLGHFEFKTLRSPTVVRLGIGGVSSKFGNAGNFSTASGYAGGPSNFFSPLIKRKESRFPKKRKSVCVRQTDSYSRQQEARSSISSWRHRSISTYC